MPSSPSPPGPPGTPPFPPGTLVYTFQTPKSGRYQVNVACGDNAIAVANQTVSVYDGTTFIATLFSGAAAPAGNYIDAQGNVLSAAQWPTFNAPVTLIFQTTQINFVIGDGVNLTYIASIQVQVVLTMERVSRRLRLARRPKFWRRRVVFPLGYLPVMRALVLPKRKRFRSRLRLRVLRRRLALPIIPFPATRYLVKPKLRGLARHKPLRCLHRRLYVPVIAKPPLVIPWRPRPKPHIRRSRSHFIPHKYPTLGALIVPSGTATPGSRVIVTVR